MAEPSDQPRSCPRCAVLERRVAELERLLAAALARIAELERLLDQRTREAKRQAAPFSKGAPKTNPKTTGRKPGDAYGTQAFRTLPHRPPDQIIPVNAPSHCPSCGGRVRETHVDQHFQIEIPRRAVLRRFDLHMVIFGGNRTWTGAHALEVLASLFATCRQNGLDALDLLSRLPRRPLLHQPAPR